MRNSPSWRSYVRCHRCRGRCAHRHPIRCTRRTSRRWHWRCGRGASTDTRADSGSQVGSARHAWAVDMRNRIVKYAKSRKGRGQYVAGAESAWRFDCSGFTKQVYRAAAKINIPHYSGAQLNMRRGVRVSKKNLLPGDIPRVGLERSQHVSIYIGGGKMIGANNPSRDVVIEPINSAYWSPRYVS